MKVLKACRCLDLYNCIDDAKGQLIVTETVPLADTQAMHSYGIGIAIIVLTLQQVVLFHG